MSEVRPWFDFIRSQGIDIDPEEWDEPESTNKWICPASPLGRIEPEYLPPRNWCPPKRRPIHRYCRISRFAFTLGQLLGYSGKVPDMVFWLCRMEFENRNVPLKRIWNTIRSRLKMYNYRLFYNRIPTIIRRLALPNVPDNRKPIDVEPILADFRRLHAAFNEKKKSLGRSYFPNLRYVALRLMERYNLLPAYHIPFTRTFRKKKSLDVLFDQLESSQE